MSNFILTGLFTEGSTDIRFLQAVVKNTLDDIAFDCTGDIETELQEVKISTHGIGFNEQVLMASSAANDFGATILFIHTDADSNNDERIFNEKIIPAIKFIETQENVCQNIVAIVPIYMTEAWMIADKKLLKSEIGIELNDVELGINKHPEEINDPKAVIEEIIRISKQDSTKRKRSKGLNISDLYQIIGQKIDIVELEKLESYIKFKESLKDILRKLNFLHT